MQSSLHNSVVITTISQGNCVGFVMCTSSRQEQRLWLHSEAPVGLVYKSKCQKVSDEGSFDSWRLTPSPILLVSKMILDLESGYQKGVILNQIFPSNYHESPTDHSVLQGVSIIQQEPWLSYWLGERKSLDSWHCSGLWLYSKVGNDPSNQLLLLHTRCWTPDLC